MKNMYSGIFATVATIATITITGSIYYLYSRCYSLQEDMYTLERRILIDDLINRTLSDYDTQQKKSIIKRHFYIDHIILKIIATEPHCMSYDDFILLDKTQRFHWLKDYVENSSDTNTLVFVDDRPYCKIHDGSLYYIYIDYKDIVDDTYGLDVYINDSYCTREHLTLLNQVWTIIVSS